MKLNNVRSMWCWFGDLQYREEDRNGTAIINSIIIMHVSALCIGFLPDSWPNSVIHYDFHPFIQAEAMKCHNEA